MLAVMIGPDKVVSSVTADIDFTQENRVEDLVDPVNEDIDNLPVSVESIHETYSGEGSPDVTVGTGEDDITNYPAGDSGQGDYELIQESVNYEFNRIQREVSESPYKIRDLGIQVAVDNRKDTLGENGEPELLTALEQADVEVAISSILDSIINTTVDGSYQTIEDTPNTSIVFQEFSAPPVPEESPSFSIPLWVMIVAGILLLVVVIVFAVIGRKPSYEENEYAYTSEVEEDPAVEALDELDEFNQTENTIKRKQLEKMALEKPDQFAKLLRTWISED